MHKTLLLSLLVGLSATAAAQEAPPEPADMPAAPAEPAAQAPPADVPVPADGAIVVDGERVSIEEIRRFVAVFRAVKQAYVDPIDDDTLMRASIRGLLGDLDPHSAYLDNEQSRDLSEVSSGAYDGLGLEVVQNPDRTLMVVAPIDDTPAARAGIRPGDLITEIDGRVITADNVDAAVDSMRGAPGSEIALTIVREGEQAPLKLILKRETIRVASVRARLLEPGFGYLRISNFQADTGRETGRKLTELMAGKPLQGLVLDLRSNPGGLLGAAVDVADAFLDSGVIVSTRGRLPFASSEFKATPGDLLRGAPVVILSDSGTASAAEVLAGALRDHKRALVMGTASFGKGSVQTVMPLDNGDSLKLTTARYYTPNGTSIQATGIRPDVLLPENVELRSTGDSPPTVRERDLPGHLTGDAEDEATAASSTPDSDDYATREALNLLKGLALFQGRSAPAKAQSAAVPPAATAANGEGP